MEKRRSQEKPIVVFIYGSAFGDALATILASLFFSIQSDRSRMNLERQLIIADKIDVLEPIRIIDPRGEVVTVDPQRPALYYFHLEGCPACARAKEALGRWLAARPEARLVVVAVPRGEGVAPEFKEEVLTGPWSKRGQAQVYFDPHRRTLEEWGVKAFPTVLAVWEGKAVGRLEGLPRGDVNLPRLLDRLLEALQTQGEGR